MASLYEELVLGVPGIGQANTSNIRASLPVIGAPHKGCGQALNWLLGRGHPVAVHGTHIFPAWTTAQFSFWIHPDDLHPRLNWAYAISCIDGDNNQRLIAGFISNGVHLPAPDVHLTGFITSTASVLQITTTEDLDPSNDPQEIHCTIVPEFSYPGDDLEPTAYLYIVVHAIHVYEMPQIRINGFGVALSTLDPRQPLYWDPSGPAEQSISALPEMAAVAHDNYARRGALFSWWSPTDDYVPNQTTSTSYVSMFPVKPAVQARLLENGATRGVVKCNVAAKVTGGTGHVRVTMTTGDSITFDVTSATVGWIGEQDLLVSTDDPARWETDGGIRGGTRDEVTIEMKAESGQTIELRGVMITEAPAGEDDNANVLVDTGIPIVLGGEYIFVPVPFP